MLSKYDLLPGCILGTCELNLFLLDPESLAVGLHLETVTVEQLLHGGITVDLLSWGWSAGDLPHSFSPVTSLSFTPMLL